MYISIVQYVSLILYTDGWHRRRGRQLLLAKVRIPPGRISIFWCNFTMACSQSNELSVISLIPIISTDLLFIFKEFAKYNNHFSDVPFVKYVPPIKICYIYQKTVSLRPLGQGESTFLCCFIIDFFFTKCHAFR